MIIHVGLDTVELNGEGFDILVKEGDTVKVGYPLSNIDLEFTKSSNKKVVTPVLITNYEDKVKSFHLENNSLRVKCKELVLKCELK
ncbi:PTS system glucose subfamily transporter subunit IIA [Clostridium pasteurianum DSM 525 = ATCC 6013]|uniref:PTS system glucose subfamily transporter subunit IIA n=1 Tax=Clostridium pasteurianum DSM 525 = ATCC 6013 TaxID=1262449 RepID=A0A0H3J5N9_CLOPA|nr:PTS glucose transporter subunit IIA [Clostridium pasteurianum]AJA49321.1 PTS system glucose subfamily transporter subunit IIA [Clostridium pasteurianum DSM 525 = ATCC 6013]AJA53309.1 PTS system glucose subfamily transporter subunit IIA [Clostridium pasteurianum DSM 525 = ATCC 6013]AOZ76497.1 hypothetical protein AQ983_15805 [Clostridium pasteurianum DSM 525 = ATCC 6013]AOZ80294.1 hypothetical protein AQ984_15800 [Clostridium pasteurianum]ELP58341.1 PTS system glucose subfamily transporter s